MICKNPQLGPKQNSNADETQKNQKNSAHGIDDGIGKGGISK